ncbi:hypothetical protein OG413_45040 [Streptomyces sp. NBC_01433]|uniref:hypothetical protein n=1 Tax=Streptomyces sp. NBC_01433 TaxID=2903864 RepID=UPI0022583C29|nr:hypothetical protein [Streptomyces sp. NBC_01433]MCX4682353.1 hypothetical protein [Streptomyces sp. NBC_01433]
MTQAPTAALTHRQPQEDNTPIQTMPLNANGHSLPGASEVTVIQLEGHEPLVSGPSRCAICGIYPKLRVTDDSVEVQDPCPYPNGITTDITLIVPSGKLLVTDDLRPVYDWQDDAAADYNTALGQAQVVEAMAAIGCAYGPVRNSCPGLYRTGPDSYIIASPRCDEDDNPSLPEDTCLASICTDLWAYSIADFEHWKAQGGNPDELGWSDSVIDVAPGTYRFTHHTGEHGFDHYADETVIFAHIKRLT